MFRYNHGPIADGHWWFGLVGLIFWVLAIGGIVYLLVHYHEHFDHHAHHQDHTAQPNEPTDPLDIAKSRYARGDITQQEFTQIKKDLS